ncbi:glycosyltransferase [Candidatus Bathyarchaeota archaeon]|nr:glycosyltransferase [Candidatus Bathyarchaeota archaeon]
MRILFNTIRSDNLVNLNVVHYLEQETAKLADCQWSGAGWENHVPGEPIDETVKRLYGADPPDYIVNSRADIEESMRVADARTPETPRTVMTIGDMHVEPEAWVETANRGFDGALMRYLYSPYAKRTLLSYGYYSKFDEDYYLDNLKPEKLHFPWFTDHRIYHPSEEKEHDVIFLGAYRRKVYPLRYDIVKELPKLCEENNWRYLIRDRPPGKTPTRDVQTLTEQGHIVGPKYAETIAKAKVFIFGNSIFRYPVSKYFEIMGSGILVMANRPQSAEELHFRDGDNYVEINRQNWKEKLRYYLEDDAERERIARRGYETVNKYHTSEVRAGQLVEFLGKLE